MAAEKAHAEYSASGSARWINCPGSHARAKLYPPLPESKYSAEGTEAHACFEFLMKNRAKLLPAVQVAMRKYPAEMVEHCVDAARYVVDRIAQAPSADVLIEEKLDASPFLCSDQFGTLDIGIVEHFGTLEIIDFKYGAGISVEPREDDGRLNSQLAYYALALSYKYDHNFEKVRLTVIQPRAFHASGETTRSAEATIAELLSWRAVFRDALMETNQPDAALKAGKWCKFCPASLDCPELKDKSFKAAQIAFSDSAGITAPLPAPTQLPHLGRVLDACDKLEEWIAKVRAHAFDVLEKGGEVPGYKLVEKRGVRRWIDEEKAASEAGLKFTAAAFTPPKLLSPAKMEAKFKSAKEWVAARVTTVSSGVTLAPQSDKRPAITNGVTGFTAIES